MTELLGVSAVDSPGRRGKRSVGRTSGQSLLLWNIFSGEDFQPVESTVVVFAVLFHLPEILYWS